MKEKRNIIIGGALIGFISVISVFLGNPKNMGICIACFIRDIAGSLGLHNASVVQYIRPEIIGIVLGSFILSLSSREFKSRGGSSIFIRFCLGFMIMVGALMFLGCPTRMVLRLAGGDLNAIFGIVGFVAGIGIGIFCLQKGFSLKRNYKQTKLEGFLFPAINVILLVLLISSSSLLLFSIKGPGSQHAPVIVALAVGLVVGVVCQKTRLCMVGGFRDLFLFKDSYLLLGFLAMLIAAFVGNLIFGFFKPSFVNQPVAHTNGLWNFLGMVVAGWGSVLLGGCPMRQLVLSGEGNIDSVITILGMLVGAAFCHNFKLASSPKGPTPNGQIAVIICFIILGLISYYSCKSEKTDKNKIKGDVNFG
ncbi:YedE-related selenium metabolism membrane protein [Paeniclostridium sordellii]|uniref:YedE family putative selenium transporter n=1 Tax=Paraclostridium sordellii TaxID=1505 RepID=UPI0012ED792E|nr:YedE family putative selenium transporter [Paeniclostridium sordellii]MDU6483096.1 YedE family putative selenium transporter [Paeniclostridium sordellii]MVO75154.1 YedE-related selenium metabolism membrane protein [Paeniclostridium sordellii]